MSNMLPREKFVWAVIIIIVLSVLYFNHLWIFDNPGPGHPQGICWSDYYQGYEDC